MQRFQVPLRSDYVLIVTFWLGGPLHMHGVASVELVSVERGIYNNAGNGFSISNQGEFSQPISSFATRPAGLSCFFFSWVLHFRTPIGVHGSRSMGIAGSQSRSGRQ